LFYFAISGLSEDVDLTAVVFTRARSRPPADPPARSCLKWDPRERFTPEDALQHEWILEGLTRAVERPPAAPPPLPPAPKSPPASDQPPTTARSLLLLCRLSLSLCEWTRGQSRREVLRSLYQVSSTHEEDGLGVGPSVLGAQPEMRWPGWGEGWPLRRSEPWTQWQVSQQLAAHGGTLLRIVHKEKRGTKSRGDSIAFTNLDLRVLLPGAQPPPPADIYHVGAAATAATATGPGIRVAVPAPRSPHGRAAGGPYRARPRSVMAAAHWFQFRHG